MRILLIEDDQGLGGAVQGHLTLAGHAVDHVTTLDEAEAALAITEYDLLLLDLGLPDGSGLALLRAMRAREDWRPTIVLTARDQISDRIAGLKAGADDYLVKPFDLDELAARVQAVGRRGRSEARQAFHVGTVTIAPADRLASIAGAEVTLTAREWAIIDRLLRRPGAIVSREQIEQALYAFGEEVESNAVEVHISRIRKKLGTGVIDTLRGVGYRMRS